MWPGVPNDGTLLCVWYARHSASLQAAGASGKDMRMVICQTRMRIWEGLREELHGPHSREEARAAWARAEARVDARPLRPPPQADSIHDDELALATQISLVEF